MRSGYIYTVDELQGQLSTVYIWNMGTEDGGAKILEIPRIWPFLTKRFAGMSYGNRFFCMIVSYSIFSFQRAHRQVEPF